MAAQVEVQTGEVGRTGVGGRLHLTPLTDSSNKSLIEGSSSNQGSLIITPEPSKPAPGPKPRLTPKPFAVDKNPTIRPILAPKPQAKPRPEPTRPAGIKPVLPSTPKPQQPVVIGKPRPVSTNPNRPAPTSFKPSPNLNTGQTTKPVVQPFKPAPPLAVGDPSKPTPPQPAEREKSGTSRLPFSRSPKKPPAAEWSGTTKMEEEKDKMASSKGPGGPSMTRAKSMGFLIQIGQGEEEREGNKHEAAVPLRPQPRGSRPRPVSAIFLPSSTKMESPTPAPRWAGRRPLSADLTSKFESIGLSLHRKSPKANSKENTPEERALLRRRETEKDPSATTTIPQAADGVAKPAVPDQGNKKKEEASEKEMDEDKGGGSIKRRISLLLDSSSSPGAAATGQGSEPRSPVQPIPEAEPPLGVKQRIKQLTEDTPPAQSPLVKPTLKPRPLPLDLTKRFTSERSADLGSPSFNEATDRHENDKDPQRRFEESATIHSDQKNMEEDNKDPQEQLTEASMARGSDEGQTAGSTSKESGPSSEVQMVRASLFENVVERYSVLVVDEDQPKDKAKALLRNLSLKKGNSENEGTLVTATYREPASPSSPLRVLHSFDTVQAVEESRAVSESIPLAQLEDKAMTLRSRRSEGSRPTAERSALAQGEPDLASMPEQQPRYLRVGALHKWTAADLEQEAGIEKGIRKESERERQMALEKERERQREADREEAAAAPKRLKMLQADEQTKPRATYFALTGQIQEPVSPGDEGADRGDMAAPFDDFSVRSGQWGSQGKILPLRRNPSLDEAFGKSPQSQNQGEESMERSQISESERGSAWDRQPTEEEMEVEKQRELKRETDRQKGRMKELEREKQRQLETERQAHLEFARMKEREMQREFERQRQKEFEKEKRELEKRRELERQKQLELEKEKLQELERQRELERERQRELERERQRQIERERQRELERERQREIERERQRELEREKQQELEKERQHEQERQRQREQERQRELDKERRLLEMQKERQLELERMKEMERRQFLEFERQKQKERERQQLLELERERLREKMEREEAEKMKRMAIQQEVDRQKELEREREQQRMMEKERLKEVERERQRELERQRQRDLERERQKQLDFERQELENQRLRQREYEKERQRKEELEKIKEMERRQLLEFEKQKQVEKDRQLAELEKLRLRERMEREEAEKMRKIAKLQEAERQRLKEKQRKDEQERVALDSSPLRPKVLDLDSVLRDDPFSKATSQHSDPATRWKQASPRADEPYKPAILDIDSFTSQTQPSPSKDMFPVAGIQGIEAGSGARSQPLTPERDGSRKVPPEVSLGRPSPVWTASVQDPWELKPGEMSVDRPMAGPEPPRKPANKPSLEQLLLRQEERLLAPERRWSGVPDERPHLAPFPRRDANTASSPGRVSSSTPMEQIWFPREPEPHNNRGEVWGHRRAQGSQELNRMRSRSVSRRSAPLNSAVEGSLSRMRSRSAHRERDRHSWQKQSVSGEEDGKDSDTPVHETDSQYGTWETGLRTDDSLTPATPTSDGNLTPSPRKPTPPHTLGEHASPFDPDAPDGLSPSSPPESQPLPFPDAPTSLLDTSALRSRAQLGKKRGPRSRPSRAARQSAALTLLPEGEGGATKDWRFRDSTEEKAESKQEDSDSEEQARGIDHRSAAASQPQRIQLFPGMDPSALKAQLKKRGDSDNQTDGPAPSSSQQLSHSPKSPFLPRAARVLPPAGGKENGEEDSPQWLKELKSKKRLSQYENDS
ncbi:uncharacterized protein KIAA1671 isoform X2 [Centroberyx affinis]|uniref:uncharacterized protein KIAA1671 isoform X2 n=1 Tax=Centroberyx affinis TaxID=166261 RepID=UPI003A5B992C